MIDALNSQDQLDRELNNLAQRADEYIFFVFSL
jgi:hypothetical protein